MIFDGGKRLVWFTTFETDWDPYVEDAFMRIGIDNFTDWIAAPDRGGRVVCVYP